jgi:hypothetical protein
VDVLDLQQRLLTVTATDPALGAWARRLVSIVVVALAQAGVLLVATAVVNTYLADPLIRDLALAAVVVGTVILGPVLLVVYWMRHPAEHQAFDPSGYKATWGGSLVPREPTIDDQLTAARAEVARLERQSGKPARPPE